jgi:signal transduction histidine kinase
MSLDDVDKLALLIRRERDALLSTWRELVRKLPSAQGLDTPTLNDHIPQLLEELAAALELKQDQTIPEALSEGTPPAHGLQRLRDGFDIGEVVAEYNILRGCIHDLADQNGLKLQGRPFHIVNRVLDRAIGLAVQSYATKRALEVQQRREEYLAFVAHDLKTPLHVISLAGKVLERLVPPEGTDTEAHRMFKALSRNVLRLEGLVNKVLEENSNLETESGIKVERRDLDLWPLVEALIHDIHPVAGTGSTRLINEVPDDLVAHADAGLLRRVFQNLIANAIRYTPRGEVAIGARQLDALGAVECWVKDNGTGIRADLLEKAFEKGETDSGGEGGSGLGLAIVRTFTEAQGGEVSVESKVGVGSTFRFSLPSRDGSAAKPADR